MEADLCYNHCRNINECSNLIHLTNRFAARITIMHCPCLAGRTHMYARELIACLLEHDATATEVFGRLVPIHDHLQKV